MSSDEIAQDIKKHLKEQSLDQQLVSGTKTLIARYQTLSKKSIHLHGTNLAGCLEVKFHHKSSGRCFMESGKQFKQLLRAYTKNAYVG